MNVALHAASLDDYQFGRFVRCIPNRLMVANGYHIRDSESTAADSSKSSRGVIKTALPYCIAAMAVACLMVLAWKY
jgi:predicted transporter